MTPTLALDGYTACAVKPPPPNEPVRFRHELTGQEFTMYARNLSGDTTYLWWKRTGIGKRNT